LILLERRYWLIFFLYNETGNIVFISKIFGDLTRIIARGILRWISRMRFKLIELNRLWILLNFYNMIMCYIVNIIINIVVYYCYILTHVIFLFFTHFLFIWRHLVTLLVLPNLIKWFLLKCFSLLFFYR
jgi:hypothetical protein